MATLIALTVLFSFLLVMAVMSMEKRTDFILVIAFGVIASVFGGMAISGGIDLWIVSLFGMVS